jgi:ABC-type transporter Mla maintaining outer membrane lipid asymmetry ATPase subunit MlaF
MIMGDSGSGKSVLQRDLLADGMRLKGPQIVQAGKTGACTQVPGRKI